MGSRTSETPLLPHQHLLIAAATSPVCGAPEPALEQALAAPGIDWPCAIVLATRHGLAQRLACHLRRLHAGGQVPAWVAAKFGELYAGNAARQQVVFRETAALIGALHAAGIRCLVLKGVALSVTAYADPVLRYFSDIDLLVNEPDYGGAGRAISPVGYAAVHIAGGSEIECEFVKTVEEDLLTATMAPEYDAAAPPDVLSRYARRVTVDIHRGLFRDAMGRMRRADSRAAWEAPRQASLPDGTRFCTLPPEMMLVHLAAHAADHAFSRLYFLIDMAAVVAHWGNTIEWQRTLHLALQLQVEDHLFTGLRLVRDHFGAQVPDEVGSLVERHSAPGPTLANIVRRAEARRGELEMIRWRTAPRGVDRYAAVLRAMVPPLGEMRRLYGVRSGFAAALLYAYRPVQLAGRLARGLTRLAAGRP